MRFKDQIAFVTGATSGIGRATALAFAAEGAHVALAGRRAARLDETAAAVRARGVRALPLAGDVRDPEAARAWVAAVERDFGRLDYLVNAAGVIGPGAVFDTPLEEWDRQMNTNVRGLFALTQAAVPLLRKGRAAAVVCISSVTSYRAYANLMPYCVSKAAVDMFVRCAALDLAPHGIRVNALNPGVVRSELHTVSGAVPDYPAFLERSKSTHPLGRVGEPEDIAAAVLFLCSKEAGWVTGATLPIDGGRGLLSAR
ncbi:MAG TPA: SDR family oxidoreductase [Candidatus Saccharimonadales bacterium]|nr:SDR family oxidoreductase [Candidatus Saccharimonadales bacterium]